MSTAHERVRAYLDGVKALPFGPIEPAELIIDAVFAEGQTREITLGDLQILIMQAEAFERMAPHAAKIIEHSVLEGS